MLLYVPLQNGGFGLLDRSGQRLEHKNGSLVEMDGVSLLHIKQAEMMAA